MPMKIEHLTWTLKVKTSLLSSYRRAYVSRRCANWNTPAFHPVNPYMNMYGNQGMLPFTPSIMPVTPYGVPPYMASTYGNLPINSGITRMGGLAPVRPRGEQSMRRSENLSHEKRLIRALYARQRPSEYEDDVILKRHDSHEPERSSKYRSHRNREKAVINSEEILSLLICMNF